MKRSLSKAEKESYRKWLEHTANFNSLTERDISLEDTLQDSKRVPSENEKTTVEERILIRFTIDAGMQRCLAQGWLVPRIYNYDMTYIIPTISANLLKLKTVNNEQLECFYANYNDLIQQEKKQLYTGLTTIIPVIIVIHPLLPAIKNIQKQLYLRILNQKFSLSEIRYTIESSEKNKGWLNLRIALYMPTIIEFDRAAEEIMVLNREVLKSAVGCLTRFKLPFSLLDIIVNFIKLDDIIFNTMDVALLRALVIKQKVVNTENSLLLGTGTTLCGVKDLVRYSNVKKVQQQSLKEAENKGIIGPREIIDFDLEDVEDDGNCFYYAIANQMKTINHSFILNVPEGTDPNNSLRLAIQRENFLDREWADYLTFDRFVIEFPDIILSIIDTRNPNAGFTCYYIDDERTVITNTGQDSSLVIPQGKMIIRITATGNHFISIKSHPEIDRGSITSSWAASTAERLQASDHITQTDIIIEAVFSIKYDNQLLNHEQLLEILKIAKAKGGAMVLMELMNLKDFETFEFLEAEKIVDQIIEQNFFLSNEQGRKFIQTVANHFDKESLLKILELGRDQEVAEQILIEAEAQGAKRVIATLLGKEISIAGTTENIENIIGTQELKELQLMPNGIFNSWSNKAYLKVVEYIDNLAKTLDDLLNTGKSGSQVAVTIALLEEWLGFAASGQRFIGGRPPYYNPDDNDGWVGDSGSNDENNNSSARNFDSQNEFVGLILPLYNGTDYNITDYQM